MIFVTGDCHGTFSKFDARYFPDQKKMTRDDYVIICGDFGIWDGSPDENWWLDWLDAKSFTTLFVDGNHENFDRLYSDEFPIVDFHGGKAHKIRENIFHLMRGYVFDLQGKTFFAFGGASSHDISDGVLDRNDFKTDEQFKKKVREYVLSSKIFRINHTSWWKEELPSREEMSRGLNNLAANGDKVDFVISHCCPADVACHMGFYDNDIITQYFNTVASDTQFERWFFGHYHTDRDILDKYTVLYSDIKRIV